MITIELPYPPTVNHYWGRKGHQQFLTKKGRMFREAVAGCLIQRGVRYLRGRLQVGIDLHPPDRRKRDVDNVLKPTLDALEKGKAFADDFQIWRLAIERKSVVAEGKAIVRIEPYDEQGRFC